MGVQVIQRHSDLLRFGVSSIRQPAHLMGEVFGEVFGESAKSSAKSSMVRRSVTATCLQPASGSQVMNKFRVPLRWYS